MADVIAIGSHREARIEFQREPHSGHQKEPARMAHPQLQSILHYRARIADYSEA